MFVFHINYKDPDKPSSITRCKELVEWCEWFVTKLETLIWSSPMLTTNRQQKGHQWWIVIRYTPVNEHSDGKWILWRCISYWEWGYSIAMLVYQRVNFEVLFISSYKLATKVTPQSVWSCFPLGWNVRPPPVSMAHTSSDPQCVRWEVGEFTRRGVLM